MVRRPPARPYPPAIGEREWAALYQQRPTPETGDFFRREWLRWYEEAPRPETLRVYGASDYAVTAGGGDWTVHVVVGLDADDTLFVLDLWRGRADSAAWIDAYCHLVTKWRPIEWAEEGGQIARSLGPFIDARQRETGAWCRRKSWPSISDKGARAQAIRGRMAQGKVYLPARADWTEMLVAELMTFPAGVHDDQVDALGLVGRMLGTMRAPRKAPRRDRAETDYRVLP